MGVQNKGSKSNIGSFVILPPDWGNDRRTRFVEAYNSIARGGAGIEFTALKRLPCARDVVSAVEDYHEFFKEMPPRQAFNEHGTADLRMHGLRDNQACRLIVALERYVYGPESSQRAPIVATSLADLIE